MFASAIPPVRPRFQGFDKASLNGPNFEVKPNELAVLVETTKNHGRGHYSEKCHLVHLDRIEGHKGKAWANLPPFTGPNDPRIHMDHVDEVTYTVLSGPEKGKQKTVLSGTLMFDDPRFQTPDRPDYIPMNSINFNTVDDGIPAEDRLSQKKRLEQARLGESNLRTHFLFRPLDKFIEAQSRTETA